jgi:hypothetical protein
MRTELEVINPCEFWWAIGDTKRKCKVRASIGVAKGPLDSIRTNALTGLRLERETWIIEIDKGRHL